MKIIDLLNKIANNEEVPKEIEYRDVIFRYDYYSQWYIQKNYDKYNDLLMQLSDHTSADLNKEVEIIEEDKKIEKLEVCMKYDYKNNLDNVEKDIHTLVTKINEIIDKINNINIILSPSEIAIDKCKKIDYLMENKQ